MNSFKKIYMFLSSFFKRIYKIIDKLIIIPITKFILFITDKIGNRTDRFEKFITKKNTLVFISLVLAIMLFLYVDSESTAIVTNSAEVLYGQKVEVSYNDKSYVVEGLPDAVDVTLIGRQVDLYLAKQLSGGVVTADLSGLTEGMHTIKLDYDCSINSVSYKLDPSVVNITIYPKISQTRTATIDVINKNKLDKKLSISNIELENSEVVVKGAEHVLSEVAVVKALIDVSKIINPKIGVTSLDDIKLVAYNSDGEVIKGLEMEPNKLKANITISSPSKEVPIKVIPTGELEFGKAIDAISTDITKITIYGDQDIIDNLEYIPVEVDISKLNENKSYNVIISKPSGVKEMSDTNIKVNITLGTEISKEIEGVSIETANLDSQYKAVAIGENSSKTSVVVKGTKKVLDSIDDASIKAQVDLSGYSEGEYEVEVKVMGEDNKASYTPKTTKIKIKISKK